MLSCLTNHRSAAALMLLFLFTLPNLSARAEENPQPWEPFISAVWHASKPEEYVNAQKVYDRISQKGHKLPHDDLPLILALNRLAIYYHNQGNSEAEEVFRVRSFRLQEKRLGGKNPWLADPLQHLATIWQNRKEYTRAEQALNRALKLVDDRYGEQHLMSVHILENLVTLYRITGQTDLMIPLQHRIVKQLKAVLPPSSPSYTSVMLHEAELMAQKGQGGEATEKRKAALDHYMKTSGPFHLARIKLLRLLADEEAKQGKYEEAAEKLKNALAISVHVKGVDHPDLIPIFHRIAYYYQLAEKPDLGRPYLERSLVLLEKNPEKHQEQAAMILYKLAENHRLAGEAQSALSLYQRALETLTKNGSPSPQKTMRSLLAKTHYGMAHILRSEGNVVSAEQANREALGMWAQIKDEEGKEEEDPKAAIQSALAFQQALVTEITTHHQPDFVFPKDKRKLIQLLQARLSSLGFDPGPVDGWDGPRTRKATEQFNRVIGLLPMAADQKTVDYSETLRYLPPVIQPQENKP